jgi:mRNA interferase MazF
VTIAPVSTRTRGIPTEVVLGRSEGMPHRCAVNLDSLTTIPKRMLARRITTLSASKLASVERALRFALGLI